MNFDSISEIEEEGFTFGGDMGTVRRNRSRLPERPGVYILVTPDGWTPRFMLNYRIYKGARPTRSIAELEARWVEGTVAVYIGKAGGSGYATNLRKRVAAYARGSAGHSGGNAIWQLENGDDLLVYCKPTAGNEPVVVEAQLLAQFRRSYNKEPFANGVNRTRD